jgi:hypothetical protein
MFVIPLVLDIITNLFHNNKFVDCNMRDPREEKHLEIEKKECENGCMEIEAIACSVQFIDSLLLEFYCPDQSMNREFLDEF